VEEVLYVGKLKNIEKYMWERCYEIIENYMWEN